MTPHALSVLMVRPSMTAVLLFLQSINSSEVTTPASSAAMAAATLTTDPNS